ncbi:MAG TPA: short-chain fatty acyl-CoA regulator family protein [Stellaceae bacterium]|nr:short-chain fatty acyl-CoA regulator family protein [Stellaceae bacterium]
MAETRFGGKLRRLRQDRRLSQAQMAEQLGISASYLNLLEHNQRPITVPVLIKLSQRFAVDIEMFNATDDARLLSELMEAFADPMFDAHDIKAADVKELVGVSANLGRAALTLYQAYRGSRSASRAPNEPAGPGEPDVDLPAGMPSEEVSDFIQLKGNYFADLEAAAETLWHEHNLSLDTLYQDLARVLATRFAVDVAVLPADEMGDTLRSYKPLSRRLCLSELLPVSSRSFQLAHQIALLGSRDQIQRAASGGKFTTVEADLLARSALANYFAGAVMMPYERFLEAARTSRHDLDILQHRFGTSFEQVCHRLTTLRRPGAAGVPFHLLRVDIAGNISKRYNGSGIQIARFGAACPRWNVYDAFSTPGMLRIQVSRMPDGNCFFCVARTIHPAGRPATRGPFGQRVSQLSIGLGCSLTHSRELVYADGLNVEDQQAMTPIGVNCRTCERTDCTDRAMPSLYRKLEVDENRRGLSAYMVPR